MVETIVKEQVKKLVDLQKVDGEIYALRADLQEKPLQIQALSDEFEAEKKHLKELEDKLKQIQLKRKEEELELKAKEESIAKANGVLPTLKTNKEYHAKQTEIESIKADKSIVEERILKLYDEADEVTKKLEAEKSVVSVKEKEFAQKKTQIDAGAREIGDRLKVLEEQRKSLTPGIDKNILLRYEKILHHKEGLAIVPVKGHTCGGCYMNLTTQQIEVIKIGSALEECEMCARILYLEEAL